MNKKLIIPAVILLIILTGNLNTTLAHDGEKENKARFELKLENEVEDEIEAENHAEVEIKSGSETNGQEFKIKGEITSVSGNTFVVMGETITIDPSKVNEFKQKGILAAGKKVKVEGIIEGGVKIAEEINVIGTGQGRFKIEIDGDDDVSPTPVQAIPTGTITPTPTGTTSASVSIPGTVKIKANGSIEDILNFLKQVFSFLSNII